MLAFPAAAESQWAAFYRHYGLPEADAPPNDTGWVGVNCVLPTHPTPDKAHHAGFNVFSGNYRCFHTRCMSRALATLRKSPTSAVLTPREFLQLVHNLPTEDAIRITQGITRPHTSQQREAAVHFNERLFTRAYPGELPGAALFMAEAQERLHADLDIVREYAVSRGVTYETLQNFHIGYVPADPETGTAEHLAIPYTVNHRIVGIRGRSIDGRKGALKNSWMVPFNLDCLDTTSAQCAVLVEGETDALLTSQILQSHDRDIPVFGTPGVYFEDDWQRHFQQFRRIILVPQADRASQTLIRDALQVLGPRALSIAQLRWQPKQWGKDIADFVIQNGDEALLEALALPAPQRITPRLLNGPALLEATQDPVEWVIPELLERGTKTLLVGQPKSTKTFVALQLASSTVNQTPLLGIQPWTPSQPGQRALLIEEEGSLHRLGQRVRTLEGAAPSPNLYFMHRQRIRVDDTGALANLKHDIATIKPDLLVIDPYAEIHNQDENTVQGTQVVLDALNQLLDTHPDMALVIVHHAGKAIEGPRGSSALFGAVDTLIEVLFDQATQEMRLRIKGRELPPGFDEDLRFLFDGDTARHRPYVPEAHPTAGPDSLTSTATNIIDLIFKNPAGLTIQAISEHLAEPLSTVRTTCAHLTKTGLIRRDGTGRRGSPLKYQPIQ